MRFDDVMTIAEASERFGRAASTLKQACLSGRLVEGEECRKSGGVLLVTKQGLERLYGKEHPTQTYYFTGKRKNSRPQTFVLQSVKQVCGKHFTALSLKSVAR